MSAEQKDKGDVVRQIIWKFMAGHKQFFMLYPTHEALVFFVAFLIPIPKSSLQIYIMCSVCRISYRTQKIHFEFAKSNRFCLIIIAVICNVC